MRNYSIIITVILSLLFVQSCKSSSDDPEITKQELSKHIKFLASDSMKGRYPGTPEDKIIAKYIAAKFQKSGLELLFEDGLQEFEISTNLKIGDNNLLEFNDESYTISVDYTPVSFSSSMLLETDVVFAGYGFKIDMDKASWNDYADLNVKDKWVLLLRGEPTIDSMNIPFGMYSSLRSKATLAKDLGAAGVIFVSGIDFDKNDELIAPDKPEGNINIPVIHIKRKLANKILSKTISEIEEQIRVKKGPNSFSTDKKLKCKTDISVNKAITFNIVSQLITNKNNPNFIVIGAHYDHLGFGGIGSGSRAPYDNRPHYGADDNASGVSAVIEIAEKLVSVKENLNTNFIFIAFGAEEMGLIGSKYFTNNLPFADSLISTMINIDMVGRMKSDSSLQVSGIGTSIEGESMLEKLNSSYNFKLGFSHEGYGPSDHSSFYSKDIPVFFFSTGAHMDYHTPGDSIENINMTGLHQVSNYIYDLAFNLSSNNTHLTFQEAGPKMPDQLQKTKLKVTLGIMPDFSGVVKKGLRADIVIEGKPASKAGMLTGDIITNIDGYSVNDVYEYMERLSKLKAGQIITVEVIRNEKKEVLIVQL